MSVKRKKDTYFLIDGEYVLMDGSMWDLLIKTVIAHSVEQLRFWDYVPIKETPQIPKIVYSAAAEAIKAEGIAKAQRILGGL